METLPLSPIYPTPIIPPSCPILHQSFSSKPDCAEKELLGPVHYRLILSDLIELSIIHNHCAIELAIDNALYAMNVKMVFGNTPSLHHLRHRSHEPQVNQRIWDADKQRPQSYRQSSATKSGATHPSLSLEITPLDVDNPNMSSETHLRFFPTIIGSHRSSPTTPSEESRHRKRLTASISGYGDAAVDWQGMTFTALNTQSPGSSEDSTETANSSPTKRHGEAFSSSAVSIPGNPMSDTQAQLSSSVTPPSTPSLTSSSLGSPTLTYSAARNGVKDASGTRRMMLKRKSSSFLRTSSSASVTSSNENGSKAYHASKSAY